MQDLSAWPGERFAVGTATGLAGYLCVPDPYRHGFVSTRRPQHCCAKAALLGHLAEILFEFGNQSVYALRGFNVERLPRQRTVLDDLDFELNTLVFLNQKRLHYGDDGWRPKRFRLFRCFKPAVLPIPLCPSGLYGHGCTSDIRRSADQSQQDQTRSGPATCGPDTSGSVAARSEVVMVRTDERLQAWNAPQLFGNRPPYAFQKTQPCFRFPAREDLGPQARKCPAGKSVGSERSALMIHGTMETATTREMNSAAIPPTVSARNGSSIIGGQCGEAEVVPRKSSPAGGQWVRKWIMIGCRGPFADRGRRGLRPQTTKAPARGR
jgi:hypothetical protein